MTSTAFLDRLSIRTGPERTINEVSFLTNEQQTGMILIAMALEITPGAVPSGADRHRRSRASNTAHSPRRRETEYCSGRRDRSRSKVR
jgi:hypothetical protein